MQEQEYLYIFLCILGLVICLFFAGRVNELNFNGKKDNLVGLIIVIGVFVLPVLILWLL